MVSVKVMGARAPTKFVAVRPATSVATVPATSGTMKPPVPAGALEVVVVVTEAINLTAFFQYLPFFTEAKRDRNNTQD